MNEISQPTSLSVIPLWLKLLYSGFMAVLIPYYWQAYGPANFLWFCDVALIVTLIGMWRESPLLISTQAVAIVAPQILWIISFATEFVSGYPFLGLASYMFDDSIPLFVRGLSLFHGWMPLLLLWLVYRVGFDRRAWLLQTLIAAGVLTTAFLVLDGPTTLAGNVNKVFGLDDKTPQTWMPAVMWVGVLCVGYPLAIYLPSHLVFRRVMPMARASTESCPTAEPTLSRVEGHGL